MAKNRMKYLFSGIVFLLISCIPKPFAVSREGEKVKVYFKEIGGRYGQLVEKTQFYVFRDSKGMIVPVEDSLDAEYYILFSINSSLTNIRNPEDKIYDVIVKVRPRDTSTLIGMAVSKDEGTWEEVVTPISRELANNLLPIFEGILKERNKKKTPVPEEENQNE